MTELSGNLTRSFPQHLQEKAVEAIDARGLSHAELAEKLGIFPEGARRIMNNKQWPASLGLRVLEALDIDVEVSFPDRTDK